MARIALVGGGSMGEALLSGLLRAGRQVKDLVVAERMPDRARYLAETYGVLVTSLPAAVDNATFVIIAVKPSDVGPVVGEIAKVAAEADHDSPDQVFITVAAGVTTTYLESKLLAGTPVVRVMPNAPALVGAGISAMAAGRFATPEQLKEVAALFDSVGAVLTVPEEHLDAVTAVTGSGPAYFFLMIEALVDAGVGVGLNRAVATELVVQTMAGSAALLLDRMEQDRGTSTDSGHDLSLDTTAARLRSIVTSPGGTTAAALRELEKHGLRTAVDEAVRAAKTRSEQLRITPEEFIEFYLFATTRRNNHTSPAILLVVCTCRCQRRGSRWDCRSLIDWVAMTSMNGPSAGGKSGRDTGSADGQQPRTQFLTVAEVAALMRVSKMTVYRLVHNGELPAVRVGRSFRVHAKAVHDMLESSYFDAG